MLALKTWIQRGTVVYQNLLLPW
ncbi:hypothetical protein IHE44_0001376 [Lamprotornis superbus]|uniref:Uncharacterized protein n=1 Tax=Lamprotornis superbus TaxID=245042 RepID=A0A835NRC4_9PASS|nr:hypothetical protein IHE44_0001376 [Lamprotornis superbus]